VGVAPILHWRSLFLWGPWQVKTALLEKKILLAAIEQRSHGRKTGLT